MDADYVIVGAGSAGCVLAKRLSEDLSARVILLDALGKTHYQSDDELLDCARSSGSTVYHTSCSCMMGNHGMAVVDDQLRVRRLEASRVVDASVMSAVSSTNTNAPTIMIAEKGAAMIKASAREKLAA